MKEVLLWGGILIFFITSMVMLFFPSRSSTLFLWGGFFIYQFWIDPYKLTVSFWFFMFSFTLFMFMIHFLVVNNYTISKSNIIWSEEVGYIPLFLGILIFPPFGLIVVPFSVVFMKGIFRRNRVVDVFVTSFVTVILLLDSIIARASIQLVMILIFVGYVTAF